MNSRDKWVSFLVTYSSFCVTKETRAACGRVGRRFLSKSINIEEVMLTLRSVRKKAGWEPRGFKEKEREEKRV